MSRVLPAETNAPPRDTRKKESYGDDGTNRSRRDWNRPFHMKLPFRPKRTQFLGARR
jgi:hypothetical protein